MMGSIVSPTKRVQPNLKNDIHDLEDAAMKQENRAGNVAREALAKSENYKEQLDASNQRYSELGWGLFALGWAVGVIGHMSSDEAGEDMPEVI
jgi:hypothetical protein